MEREWNPNHISILSGTIYYKHEAQQMNRKCMMANKNKPKTTSLYEIIDTIDTKHCYFISFLFTRFPPSVMYYYLCVCVCVVVHMTDRLLSFPVRMGYWRCSGVAADSQLLLLLL